MAEQMVQNFFSLGKRICLHPLLLLDVVNQTWCWCKLFVLNSVYSYFFLSKQNKLYIPQMHHHTAVFRSVPPSMLANIHRLQEMKSRLHLPRWDPQRGCDECRYAWISVGWKTDQGLRWLWWVLSPIQPPLVWECVCEERGKERRWEG